MREDVTFRLPRDQQCRHRGRPHASTRWTSPARQPLNRPEGFLDRKAAHFLLRTRSHQGRVRAGFRRKAASASKRIKTQGEPTRLGKMNADPVPGLPAHLAGKLPAVRVEDQFERVGNFGDIRNEEAGSLLRKVQYRRIDRIRDFARRRSFRFSSSGREETFAFRPFALTQPGWCRIQISRRSSYRTILRVCALNIKYIGHVYKA